MEALEKEFPDIGLKFSIGKQKYLNILLAWVHGLLQVVKSALMCSPLAGTRPFAYSL